MIMESIIYMSGLKRNKEMTRHLNPIPFVPSAPCYQNMRVFRNYQEKLRAGLVFSSMKENLTSLSLRTLEVFRINCNIVWKKIDCYLFWIHRVSFSLLCLLSFQTPDVFDCSVNADNDADSNHPQWIFSCHPIIYRNSFFSVWFLWSSIE